MQEIYTMIMNSSVTTIIVIIFLWQYINEHKKDNKKSENSENKVNTTNKNDNNFVVLLISKLDDILQKVDEIVFILKNKE